MDENLVRFHVENVDFTLRTLAPYFPPSQHGALERVLGLLIQRARESLVFLAASAGVSVDFTPTGAATALPDDDNEADAPVSAVRKKAAK